MVKAHITDGEVHLSTGQWSDTFPDSKLDGWFAFYRKMAEPNCHIPDGSMAVS